MTINWSALIDGLGEDQVDGELMPPGDYTVTCVSARHSVSQSRKLMFGLRLKVEGGAYNGRELWHNMVVSPESDVALAVLFRQLMAFGMSREYMAAMPTPDDMVERMKGGAVVARIATEQFLGATQNVVKMLYPQQLAAPTRRAGGERA